MVYRSSWQWFNYKLAKYKDTNLSGLANQVTATVGLLRTGELMSGQFNNNHAVNNSY